MKWRLRLYCEPGVLCDSDNILSSDRAPFKEDFDQPTAHKSDPSLTNKSVILVCEKHKCGLYLSNCNKIKLGRKKEKKIFFPSSQAVNMRPIYRFTYTKWVSIGI